MATEKRSLTFLSYAVNGRGVGHLTRQVAIGKWLRRYCVVLGIKPQHWFLTTSEADRVASSEGFATFKMPSKTSAVVGGLSKPKYLGLAKQWVWHSISLLRPDVLIVDTFAEGSFHELPSVLDLVGQRALVLRPVKAEFAQDPAFRAAVGLYDRVLVPTSSVDDEQELAPMDGLDRLEVIGPVLATESFERLSREDARRRLGVPDDKLAVLVVAGGGGDETSGALFARVAERLADRSDVHLLLAGGPLHEGPPVRGPNITWLEDPGLARLFPGVDLAVSACGFNTAHELLAAEVPTLFVPQPKVADDQAARAERFAVREAARVTSLADVGEALVALVDDEKARVELRAAAAGLRIESRARDAAEAILSMVVPAVEVQAASEALTDGVLAAGHSLADVVEIGRALSDEDEPALEDAIELLTAAAAAGFALDRLPRLALLIARRVGGDAERRVDGMSRLLSHPATTGNSSTLVSLVQLLTAARDEDVGAAFDALVATLDEAMARGSSLGDLVRLVAESKGADRPLSASFLSQLLAGASR